MTDGTNPNDRIERLLARKPVDSLLNAVREAEHAFPTGARRKRLLERATAIFQPQRSNVLKLVIRAVRRQLELIEFVGDRIMPVPVRGPADDGVVVKHRFANHDVSAHVSLTDHNSEQRFAVTLDLWGERTEEFRVSLFRDGREIASEVPRKGRVWFSRVAAGNYRVVMEAPGHEIGQLDLALEAAAA